MKRVAETQPAALLDAKRARTAPEDVDSAYVSLGETTPMTLGSTEHDLTQGSVASTSDKRRPKNIPCPYEGCSKAFDRPARLQIHIRSHTQERPFVCEEPDCGKAFFRLEHLTAHTKARHADERNYCCTYAAGTNEVGEPITCGKSFHTATRLRRHIAAHEEKEQTKCQDCGRIFRKQETLQRHIKSEHLGEDAYRCSHTTGLDDETEECGQTFATVGLLKAHEAREHSGVRYFCDQCHIAPDNAMKEPTERLGFTTYADLNAHVKTVHPPTCGLCGFVANSNKGLRAHMDITHQSLTDRQRFPCTHPGCDRKFTKRGNLKVHIQTVHGQVKAYTCGQTDLSKSKKVEGWSGLGCGTSFGTKAGLEQHVRTQHLGHPGEEVYTYQEKYKKPQGAAKAPNTATSNLTGFAYEEERPVACLEVGCESRFRKDHDLVIHLELHHSWNIDDINDALAEVAALQGDKFWIGGYDEVEEPLQQRITGYHNISEAVESSTRALVSPSEPMDLDPQLNAQR